MKIAKLVPGEPGSAIVWRIESEYAVAGSTWFVGRMGFLSLQEAVDSFSRALGRKVELQGHDSYSYLVPGVWCKLTKAELADWFSGQGPVASPGSDWELDLATLQARDLASARSGGCDCRNPIADPTWEAWDGSCKRCGGAIDLSGGAA